MQRADRTIGYFVAFAFSDGALTEIKRFKEQTGREIIPVKVSELLASTQVVAQCAVTVMRADDDNPSVLAKKQVTLIGCSYCNRMLPRDECKLGTGTLHGRAMCPACAQRIIS